MSEQIERWGVEQTETTNWIGPMRADGKKVAGIVASTDRGWLTPEALARNDANAYLIAAAPELLAALQDLESFVGVICGRGADSIIPETVRSPLGVPIKIGDIMRDARAAIAKATASRAPEAPAEGGKE